MAVTINEVARRAGVSVSTVSRALNTPDLVSATTRQRVVEAAEHLGYAPNPAARSLREGRTGSLGLVITDISNPFFPPIFKAMQARARRQGYTLLVADSDEREADELETIAALSKKVDGMILWASTLAETRLRELTEQMPIVLVNRKVPGISEVHISLTAGITQAAEHLRAYGHTRCAFIDCSRPELERGKSIRESFETMDLSLIELGPYEPRFETGLHAAPLVTSHGATAVLAHNDLVAMGVLHQLSALGVRVPQDVSVIGIDDTILASVSTPSLTTIRISPDEIATRAIDVLTGLVGGGSPAERIVEIGSHLVPRASTGPAPGR
ncbi:MAG TPA: LacI family DNA-binding transcriptional regulator [Jiangellaceae bacterium]